MDRNILDILNENPAFSWERLRNWVKHAGGGELYFVAPGSEQVEPRNENELCRCILEQEMGRQACEKSHRSQLDGEMQAAGPRLFQCHASFWNMVVPIEVEGEYFGSFLSCGILDIASRATIDVQNLAHALGLEEQRVSAALKKVPLNRKSKLEAILNLISHMVQGVLSERARREKSEKQLLNYVYGMHKFNTLYKVYKSMRSNFAFDDLQEDLLRIVKEDTKVDAVFIYLLDEDSNLPLTGSTKGFEDFVGKVALRFSMLRKSLENHEYTRLSGYPLSLSNTEKDKAYKMVDGFTEFSSRYLIPLISNNNVVIGCMEFTKNSPNAFSRMNKNFFSFVNHLTSQCAMALEIALLRRKTEMLSVTDEMTGLFNFRYFSQKLREEITRCARYGHTLSLIMIDLDKFKDFNDTFGHPAGDDALRALASIMRQSIRDVDVAARYGGEEFVIILPETTISEAMIIIERIREKVAQYDFIDPNHEAYRKLTISAGIASFPMHATSAEELIKKSDQALYYSKTHGRNQITEFPLINDQEQTDVVKLSNDSSK